MRMTLPYIAMVIRSFRSRALRHFAEGGASSGLKVRNPDSIRRVLLALNAAMLPENMNVPGFRFQALKGQDRGRYAVTGADWRVTFGWQRYDAIDVDLEEYP